MSPDRVAALIERAKELWGLAPDCEITLEVNPRSVEAARCFARGFLLLPKYSPSLNPIERLFAQLTYRRHEAA